MTLYKAYYHSPRGPIELVSSETGVKEVTFVKEVGEESLEQPAILRSLKEQLKSYFEEDLQNFNLNLEPEGTDFQKRVWEELCQIPYGKTISYDELARKLGDPKVIRAAASANGKNPIGILIPCHRVIGKNGSLVGYAGGLPNKRFLLDLENRVANGVLELF
ncbi:methylated-DNA--[protein]-cysteine S-methyltransferase [Jiulongibacter sediminis]|jgi:methylated-DNA-[protein]-cysteine S-methyltransferase|uniref:methylated-DNA--[protein]-cysteine S-methyltransferase n=1 Tax=Jiulongibacter sediminis TaxID=1605367 RepID=UPI0026EE1ADA|nr:methylated-DNA--[protein]-cysteine S-methyltransferase [Jiulongibacter sediminis]